MPSILDYPSRPRPSRPASRRPLPCDASAGSLSGRGPRNPFSGATRMKFSPSAVGGAALVLLLAPWQAARADLIPWTYHWSSSPHEVHADAPGTGHVAL